MASNDNERHLTPSPREPVEHVPFDLQEHVMSEAAQLPYYWPKYNAERTQIVLQDSEVEDGTYILRPSGEPDVERKKLLTLSVKMNFVNDPTKVWHFPVIIEVVENEDAVPSVRYSLTVSSSNPITSLCGLMEYHSTRPLRGGKLPDTCKVEKGLTYDRKQQNIVYATNGPLPANKTSHTQPPPPVPDEPEIYVVAESPEQPELPAEPTDEPASLPVISTPPTVPPVPARSKLSTSQSTRIPRSPSPTLKEPPRATTLPRPRPPQPTPRRPTRTLTGQEPPIAPRRQDSRQESDTSSIASSTSSGENRNSDDSVDLCPCGLPSSVTYLPKGWTVHRSLEPESINMLYFRDIASRTAWVLPPNVDKECKSRDYLKYGCLNVSCFRKYESQLTYSTNSELSNWSEYSTYDRRP